MVLNIDTASKTVSIDGKKYNLVPVPQRRSTPSPTTAIPKAKSIFKYSVYTAITVAYTYFAFSHINSFKRILQQNLYAHAQYIFTFLVLLIPSAFLELKLLQFIQRRTHDNTISAMSHLMILHITKKLIEAVTTVLTEDVIQDYLHDHLSRNITNTPPMSASLSANNFFHINQSVSQPL